MLSLSANFSISIPKTITNSNFLIEKDVNVRNQGFNFKNRILRDTQH